MFKKSLGVFIAVCILGLSSLYAPALGSVDMSSFSDGWRLDVLAHIVVNGNAEKIYYDNYKPILEKPLISFETPYDTTEIWRYDCKKARIASEKNCPTCGKTMGYANILYEINKQCEHGVFCYAYYCKDDSVYITDRFYTQCGCK